MITHEQDDDFEGDQDEVMMDSNPIIETEQSEFRKLPQLDSFDSQNDEALGKNDPFRNKTDK